MRLSYVRQDTLKSSASSVSGISSRGGSIVSNSRRVVVVVVVVVIVVVVYLKSLIKISEKFQKQSKKKNTSFFDLL